MALIKRREAFGRNTIAQTMRAPTQGELARGFRSLERRKIHGVMVFRIGLRLTRDDAARKYKPCVIGECVARQSNQRVFAAARWADHKHERAFFNR